MDNMDEINSTQTSPMIPVSPVDNELPTMDHVYTCTLPDILPNDCVVCRTLKISSNIYLDLVAREPDLVCMQTKTANQPLPRSLHIHTVR